MADNNDGFEHGQWPGKTMGLPKEGSGSLASVMRRTFGVLIDWLLAMLIANLLELFTNSLGGPAFLGYAVWVVMGIVCGWLFARTPGMALLGMGVARLDVPGSSVGLWRAAVRTLLTAVLFPAAMVDADGRGLHDRATGTAVIMA
ncbi:RDD family protein [uncultured Corynebacterium sp.]|uniref:RDD family protein n=1 Tax=uncultured Corynebacterium sp. TaxID=159447 RepID=UPI0028050A20|nr:RDD family protein [uncultured Corynebacterium sp.]